MTETGHRRGEPAFHRASVAMFAAGLATFAVLYVAQPLMPGFAEDFGVGAAGASLTLSVSTFALAGALLPMGWLSDAWGRTRVMRLSLYGSALLGVLCAAAPSLPVLLVLRGLQGVALAGLPAVGMAYLAEEIHHGSLGSSIGLYVGGNAIGGMLGRLVGGGVAELGGWRLAFLAVGVLGLLCAAAFARMVPAATTAPQRFAWRPALQAVRVHLHDRGQLLLDLTGALLMGCFVAVFNALGFRLHAEPYALGETAIAAVFLVYPIGSVASTAAGRLADRVGRRVVLPLGVLVALGGVGLTAAHALALIVLGVAVLTAGFFAAHSVASSWVGRRAHVAPAQASALYLLAYYAGSSVAGPVAGLAWSADRWTGVVVLAGVLLVGALVAALALRATPPLPRTPHGAAATASVGTG